MVSATRVTAIAGSLWIGLVVCLSAGSVFVDMDVSELIRGADHGIVRGRVVSLDSAWNADATMIFTRVAVLVEEDPTGRNRPGTVIDLRVPGGRVGRVQVETVGAARFAVGDRALIFVSTWSDGPLRVVGYGQGASRIHAGPDGAPILVGGSAHGMTLVELRDHVRQAGR